MFTPERGEPRHLFSSPHITLTPNDRIAFDFTADSTGRIDLRLVGYFERTPLVTADATRAPLSI